MRPSLRTVLLSGLVALNALVIAGIVATVFVRARDEAEAALRDDVALRARTLAGVVEIERDGLEFDAPKKTMPEYETPGSGTYAVVYDAAGKAVIRSPSLGKAPLRAFAAWTEGGYAWSETASGPDGIPCTLVTHSFVAQADPVAGWTPPPEEARRYQIVVARDRRPTEAALARLALFLGGIGAAALVLTAVGGMFVARRVLGPIRRLTEEAAALTPEDPSRRLEPATVARELESLSATLNGALDRLADALERQRRFTSDASHELRTPLAILRGTVDVLLRRERTPAEYRAGLERQARVVARMTAITEKLLALARADAGHVELRRERVPLAEVTRGVCGEFEGAASDSGVSLECAADDAVAVTGDPLHLGELVQNLVSNAVKFTPRGGAVRVSLEGVNGHAVLDVADSGPGVAPEDRPRIFERFYRAAGRTPSAEGDGLGLAIVDWVVRAHGGTVEVLDRDGGGALFRVRLPRV